MEQLRVFGDPILLRGAKSKPGALRWKLDTSKSLDDQLDCQDVLKGALGFGGNSGPGLGPAVELWSCNDGKKVSRIDPASPLRAQGVQQAVYVAQAEGSAGRARSGSGVGELRMYEIRLADYTATVGIFFARRANGPLYVAEVSNAAARAGIPVGGVIHEFNGKAVQTSAEIRRAEQEFRLQAAKAQEAGRPIVLRVGIVPPPPGEADEVAKAARRASMSPGAGGSPERRVSFAPPEGLGGAGFASSARRPSSPFPAMQRRGSTATSARARRRSFVRRRAASAAVPAPYSPPPQMHEEEYYDDEYYGEEEEPAPATPKYWPWTGSAELPGAFADPNLLTGPPCSPRLTRAAPNTVFDLPLHSRGAALGALTAGRARPGGHSRVALPPPVDIADAPPADLVQLDFESAAYGRKRGVLPHSIRIGREERNRGTRR